MTKVRRLNIPEKGIKIRWRSSIEYLAIDLDKPDTFNQLKITQEVWLDETAKNEIITRCVKTCVKEHENGTYTLKVFYRPENNPTLMDQDVSWGISEILLDPKSKSGKVTWADQDCNDDSGNAKWERIANVLDDERLIAQVQAKRQQAKFRETLIELDKMCAITKETCLPALDAAHIVAVKQGGSEGERNGILLRTDIHRLYDKGAFVIQLNGRVRVNAKFKGLSNNYIELLTAEEAEIDQDIMKRIEDSLRLKKSLESES